MVEVRLSERALFDLEEIFAFTARRWGEEQALAYSTKVVAAIETISQYPKKGSLRTIAGRPYRFLVVERHVIFYLADLDPIVIVRILHGNRNVQKAFRIEE